MSNVGFATVTLVPSMEGFGKAMDSQIGTAASTAGQRGGSSAGGSFLKAFGGGVVKVGAVVAGSVAAVGAAFGTAAIAKGLDRALDIQDAEKKLAGLGHSAKGVDEIMANALASVKGTAFGLGDAATVAASAVAAGIKPGKNLTRYLKLTADTATIAGASLSDMGAIMNKAHTGTAVYTDTLNQLSDRGVPVFQYLAQAYGVSQGKLSDMVRAGAVDAAHLDKALQAHLAGSALKSGDTARGAFANVGAALGRLGVLFVGGPVAEAPHFFQTLSATIDGAGGALKPFADVLSGYVVQGMKALEGWMSRLDFSKVAADFKVVTDAVQRFVAGFRAPLTIIDGQGLKQAAGQLAGIEGAGQRVRVVFDGIGHAVGIIGKAIGDAFKGKSADLSGLGDVFSKIGAVIGPLFPILLAVAKGLGSIAGAVGGLIAAGMPVLAVLLDQVTGVLKWMGAHPEVIGPIVVSLLALIAGMKVLHDVSNVASGFAAPFRAYAATMQALPAISSLATAGQWAFNAAMDANPIGIVVVAIAALVAGLVWFFTQTKVGQQVWAGMVAGFATGWGQITGAFQVVVGMFATGWGQITGGISAAWTWIQGLLATWGPVILAIIAPVIAIPLLIAQHWGQIVTVAKAVWAAVVSFVTGYINTVRSVITAVVSAIVSVWNGYWNRVRSTISTVWGAIVGFVRNYINTVRSVITTVVAAVVSVWNGYWNRVSSIIRTVWGGIVSAVSGFIGRVVSTVQGIGGKVQAAVSGAGQWLLDTGKHIVDGLVNGVRNAWGAVTSVIHDLAMAIPEPIRKALGIHSPSKVFHQIGLYIGAGLQTGLAGSAAAVKKSVQSLAAKVVEAWSAGHMHTSTKNSLVRMIDADNKRLTKLASQRDSIASRLKSAATSLANAQKTRSDYAHQVSTATSDLGVVTGGGDSASVIAGLKLTIANAKAFQSQIAQLRKAGLDNRSLQQIIGEGVAGGGMQSAALLLSGGKSNIQMIAKLQGQLTSAANSLGNGAAADLYTAGVNAAAGLVSGLKKQESAITKQMDKIADAMVSRLKKKLDIHSPSRVFHTLGAFVGQGMANGLSATRDLVVRASDALIPVPPSFPSPSISGPAGTAGGGPAPLIGTVVAHGYSADEVAARIANKTRRALVGVQIPKVRVA